MPTMSTLMQDVLDPHHWPCKEKKDRRPKDLMKVTQVMILSPWPLWHTRNSLEVFGLLATEGRPLSTRSAHLDFLIAFLFFKYMKAE